MKMPFMMPVYAARSASADPLQKFKFRLSIPGLPSSVGFQKVSGLNHEVSVVEYTESSTDYTMKMPGRQKVGEVTAERGVFGDSALHDLLKEAMSNPDVRKTFIFEQMNRFGEVAMTYKLANAWVSKWEGSDADAASDDVAIEKITIQFEYFIDE